MESTGEIRKGIVTVSSSENSLVPTQFRAAILKRYVSGVNGCPVWSIVVVNESRFGFSFPS
jgi:hypothetical protein